MSSAEDGGWVPHIDDTFVSSIGDVLERQRDSLIEIALLTTDRHRNLSGIVHGGVLMALFDRVMGVNCRNTNTDGRMATATMTINMMRPVRVGEFVEFSCRLRKKGRKAYFTDAEAWVDGKLVATATGIWMTIA